ncbi:transposase [Nocardia sp. CDC160]|uniref:transposase n=1 Tax=Nocardia sp. CDC160 TaxID=3112166 RepID=UPI002DBCC91A|nr:transposase [Nocardia sp. CDC160]MEC3917407.1 transposase [Nocardia sp. CDC160]
MATTANESKLAAVVAVLPWWQRGLVHVQLLQVRALQSGQMRLGWLPTTDLPGYLSARQWKSVVNQVNAALSSWRETAKIGIREMIRDLDIADELRSDLFRINAFTAWWSTTTLLVEHENPAKRVEVSAEALAVSQRLVARWLWRHPFPDLSRVRTMAMDGAIAVVTDSRTAHADYWVRVSTLRKGAPVQIPLHRNDYFDAAPGTIRNFCQIHITDNGDARFELVKKSDPAPRRTDGHDLGLDWGLSTLFATSDGRLMGRELLVWLKARDAELVTLTKALQSNRLKPKNSARYRRLQSRIRGYIRNEVGRILNQLADEDVKSLVVERLRFSGGGLSRQMNRLVTRAGRAAVAAKLASLTETHGILVVEVNPAYTSQTCTGCGYADRRNRTTQSRHRCRFCNKRLHADISGARTILRRSQQHPCGWLRLGKQAVLARIDQVFHARWGVDPTDLRERSPRGRSTAFPDPRRGSTVERMSHRETDTVADEIPFKSETRGRSPGVDRSLHDGHAAAAARHHRAHPVAQHL